jgi:ABC-type multidrug transport system ATPase subunit/ABC-type multidrug transport system permease subunit
MVNMAKSSTDVKVGHDAAMADLTEMDSEPTQPSKGALLQAKRVTINTRAGESLLSDISFHVEPGELISLTGLSDTGKSILLQSLAGLMKPSSGEILIDGVNLYANLKAFRSSIGYVPTEVALQPNLTVIEILQDAAILRLPRHSSFQYRRQRVQTLLETIGLTHVTDGRVGLLSRIEKRKLSIAVELIGSPRLLLVDESSASLTPFEEIQITILLRELSRHGLTVIQVDQRSRRAGLSDKVIFLAPGGLLAWYGPPEEAFIHLRKMIPRGVAKDLFGLKEALEVLANPQLQEGIEWAKRFKADPAYQKYVDDPFNNKFPDLMLQTHPLLRLRLRNNSQEKLPPPIIPRASVAQKLILLSRSNFRILWRERMLFQMLAIPPLVALVDFILSSNPDRPSIVLGVLVFLVLLTAALLVQNEIFKERTVYQRENRSTLEAFPYILSKASIVGVLAIYQALVWAIIHFAAVGNTGGLSVLGSYVITFFLVAFIGGIVGLLVSASSRTAMMTANWILLLTVPQLILSGAIVPLEKLAFPFRFLSILNPARYALDSLLTASGYREGIRTALAVDWLILAIISLLLIALLVGIQQRAGSIRT